MKGKAHASIGALTYYNYAILTQSGLSLLMFFISIIFSLIPDLDTEKSIASKHIPSRKLEIFIEAIIGVILFLTTFQLWVENGFNYYVLLILFLFLFFIFKFNIKKLKLRKIILTVYSIVFYFLIVYITGSKSHYFFVLFLGIIPWFSHRSFSHSLVSVVFLYFSIQRLESLFKLDHLKEVVALSYASHIFLGDILTVQGVPIFWPISKKRFSLISTKIKSQKYENIVEISVISFLVILAFYLNNKI